MMAPRPGLSLREPALTTADATQPVIRVRDLRKTYLGQSRRILDGVSFDVAAGEVVGILGPNGAGKTTAVEIVQGLRRRDGGTVSVLGHDPATDRARLRRLVGAQLQSSALPERLKVGEALRLFTRLADNVVDWRQLQDEWGLTALTRASFGSLSGGERQRLFVALALVNHPTVVFLDELTQGLDPAARRETWRLIARIREHGASVVMVTHDMQEAARLCDRVAVLHHGHVVACGRPDDIVATVGGLVRIRFSYPQPSNGTGAGAFAGLAGVAEVAHDGRLLEVRGDAASPVHVAAELARRGQTPLDFTVQRPSLHDAFLSLTTDGTR